MSRECPQGGGGGGPMTCYNCNEVRTIFSMN